MKDDPKPTPSPDFLKGVGSSAERTAKYLRGQLVAWKREDEQAPGTMAQVRAALFWSVNSRWATRVEAVAAALEQEAVTMRAQEQTLSRDTKRPFLSRLF